MSHFYGQLVDKVFTSRDVGKGIFVLRFIAFTQSLGNPPQQLIECY